MKTKGARHRNGTLRHDFFGSTRKILSRRLQMRAAGVGGFWSARGGTAALDEFLAQQRTRVEALLENHERHWRAKRATTPAALRVKRGGYELSIELRGSCGSDAPADGVEAVV